MILRCLYGFDADPESDELSLEEGEVFTIIYCVNQRFQLQFLVSPDHHLTDLPMN